ncbi:MAG: DUF4157 domain-containing protein [Myxococcota bacterium]
MNRIAGNTAAPQGSDQSTAPSSESGASRSPMQVQLKRASFEQGAAMLSPGDAGAVQMKGGGGDTADVHAAAEAGTQGGGGSLPHGDTIQKAFGAHDVSGIKAHTGGAASAASEAMGAKAFATGDHVAFGGGAPDLHTAAHEAAHVVQQKGGVHLAGGVGASGDKYEQHADQVADAVVAGKSAEGLLDGMAGGTKGKSGGGGVQKKAVQKDDKPAAGVAQTSEEPGKKPEGAKAEDAKPDAAKDQKPEEGGDWQDQIAKDRDALVKGAKIETVPGPDGQSSITTFKDARLEKARQYFCQQLRLRRRRRWHGRAGRGRRRAGSGGRRQRRRRVPGAGARAGQARGQAAGGAKVSGDSEAGEVKSAPHWFSVFQDHCIDTGKWDKDQKVLQILVSAYLYATMGTAPANVLAFFDHAGKSEYNGQAEDLAYGAGARGGDKTKAMQDTKMWCQQASSSAYAQGFANCGYTFTGRSVPAWIAQQVGVQPPASAFDTSVQPPKLKPGATVDIPSAAQPVLAVLLAKDIPKLVPPDPSEQGGKPVGQLSGVDGCWGGKVEGGDLASFVSHSSTTSTTGGYAAGHAVTIVEVGEGGDARPIKYVSGNAGSHVQGNGSIRFEEALWVKPPANFKLSTTRPKSRARSTSTASRRPRSCSRTCSTTCARTSRRAWPPTST